MHIYVKNLVERFRAAMDAANDDGMLSEGRFRRFPNGCCDDACDLLAKYLRDNGYEVSCVHGVFYGVDEDVYSHAWLIDDDGNMIDITGDQFCTHSKPLQFYNSVYFGPMSDFHRLFSIEGTGEAGRFEKYSEPARGVLSRTYEVVMRHL